MAKGKLGQIITDLSGSVGSTTFKRSGSGLVIYNKPPSKKTFTEDQYSVQARMSIIINHWRSITEPQRQNWNKAALNYGPYMGVGSGKKASGYQAFIKFNMLAWVGMYYPETNAPDPVRLPALAITNVIIRNAGLAIVYTQDASWNANNRVEVSAARCFRVYDKTVSGYKTLRYFSQDSTGEYEFTTELFEALGVPQVGEYVKIRVRKWTRANGAWTGKWPSQYQYFTVVTTA